VSESTFPVLQEAAGLLAQAAALLARLASRSSTKAPTAAPAALPPAALPPAAPAYLTTAEAAERLGVSKKGLEAMRSKGRGPRWVRVGKAVRYPVEGLDQ
jgi:excisionase family DNA binding protein